MRMVQTARRYVAGIDFRLLLLCVVLSCLSIAVLLSVAGYGNLELDGWLGNLRPVFTQILATVLGIAGAVLLSLTDYRLLVRYWPVHAAICWGLVLLTFIPGIGYEPAGTGSQSWIAMPFGMSFQPTEIAKISFCITYAAHLARVRDTLNKPRTLLPVLAHLALPVLLIHLQGDDGTAISFLAMGGIMLIMAGLNRWVVASCAAVAAVAAPFVWRYVVTPHQKERIFGLLLPEEYADTIMYQQLQGRSAVSAGGLFGRGLFATHQDVPRAENDFIFSFFAECYGFVGCVLLLALFFGLMVAVLQKARKAPDRVGAYICIGIFATLFFQCIVNIGMNLLLLPVMGLTLPFLSAGGTSVLMLYLSIGLVLSVGRQAKMGAGPAPDGLPLD